MSLNLPPKINGIYHHKPDCDCGLCRHPRQYNYVNLKGGEHVNENSPAKSSKPDRERT